MTSLVLHEAIPGHHHQGSLAIENPAIPPFLRYIEDRRYVLGSALNLSLPDTLHCFFFNYVYWEGKVLLYMYPTSLCREEGQFLTLCTARVGVHTKCQNVET
jgi:hypothetical protein